MTPTARYVTTDAHLVQGLLVGTARARQRVRIRYAAYGAVAAATWAFFRFVGGVDSVYLGLLAVLFLALAAVRPWLVRRQYARLLAGRADVGRRTTASVRDGWYCVEVEGLSRSEHRVEALHAVEPHAEGLLVQPFPNEYQWIPAEAFAAAADRAAFERALLAGAPLPAAGL